MHDYEIMDATWEGQRRTNEQRSIKTIGGPSLLHLVAGAEAEGQAEIQGERQGERQGQGQRWERAHAENAAASDAQQSHPGVPVAFPCVPRQSPHWLTTHLETSCIVWPAFVSVPKVSSICERWCVAGWILEGSSLHNLPKWLLWAEISSC